MFEDIKEMLIEDPQHIVNLLEKYDFCKILVRNNEIRCAVDEESNPSSVAIRLINNEKLYVKDFGRNIGNDLMGYISIIRDVPLKTVLESIKNELGIDSFYVKPHGRDLFGGLFASIGMFHAEEKPKIIPESTLDQYEICPCARFCKDGISVETQKKFGIGYSKEEQRIIIPIRSCYGELMGVKGRCNYTPDEFEPKYLYLQPCAMSQTLYGYSENYPYFQGSDILVFEAEKSVMQADSMGIHNAVALGSNSLSDGQAKEIVSAQPKTVTFMLDNSLPLENTFTNIHKLEEWDSFGSIKIRYFDWKSCTVLEEKDSPTDRGKENFDIIMENCIKEYKPIDK